MSAMSEAPALRASIAREQVEFARAALGDRWEQVLAPPVVDALARLEVLPRLNWFSAADFDVITRAIHALAGDKAYRAITRETTLSHVKGDVMGGLVRTFNAAFGTGPGMFLRAYPSGFSVLYRGFGRFEVTLSSDNPDHAAMVLLDAPPEFLGPAAQQGFAGSLEALVMAADRRPDVTLDASGVAEGTLRFHVKW